MEHYHNYLLNLKSIIILTDLEVIFKVVSVLQTFLSPISHRRHRFSSKDPITGLH